MRLPASDIEKIKLAIRKFATTFTLYLHGSRVDGKLKGGDIDLFLIVPDAQLHDLKSKKHYLDSELSLAMDDQRIDLKILSMSEKDHDSFFMSSIKVEI